MQSDRNGLARIALSHCSHGAAARSTRGEPCTTPRHRRHLGPARRRRGLRRKPPLVFAVPGRTGPPGEHPIAEAEDSRLQDGSARVAPRRRLLEIHRTAVSDGRRQGANECGMSLDVWPGSAMCRAFVVDTPWSAAFVSFVYMRAGVPGFAPSASHFDFVRQAMNGGPECAIAIRRSRCGSAAVGDLLCFTRGQSAPMGPAGMRASAERSGDSLAMHCDIVVGRSGRRRQTLHSGRQRAAGGHDAHAARQSQRRALEPAASGAMGVCTPGSSARVHFQSPGLGGAAETGTEGAHHRRAAPPDRAARCARCRCRRTCSVAPSNQNGSRRRWCRRDALISAGVARFGPRLGALVDLQPEHDVAVDAENVISALRCRRRWHGRFDGTCSTRLSHFGHFAWFIITGSGWHEGRERLRIRALGGHRGMVAFGRSSTAAAADRRDELVGARGRHDIVAACAHDEQRALVVRR